MGAGIVLLPRFSMVQMILLSQVLNGMLLPVILIFMLLLINKTNLMKEWINPPALQRGGVGDRGHRDRDDAGAYRNHDSESAIKHDR